MAHAQLNQVNRLVENDLRPITRKCEGTAIYVAEEDKLIAVPCVYGCKLELDTAYIDRNQVDESGRHI